MIASKLAPVLGLLLLSPALPGQLQLDAWKHEGIFHILTTQEGAFLPEDAFVTNFPLLVRLHRDFFDFTEARPAGEDVRFSLNRAELAHQVEAWDPVLGKASIWLLVPRIEGNTRTAVTMHWGHPEAENGSRGDAVFGAHTGFSMVMHLGSSLVDETGNSTPENRATTPVPGLIGTARHFVPGRGIFCGERITGFPRGDAAHSTSAWFRTDAANGRFLGWGIERAQSKVTLAYLSPARVRVDCYFSAGNILATMNSRPTQWTHVLHTHEGRHAKLYVNGRAIGTGNPRATKMKLPSESRMYLGGWYDRYDFDGTLDEVRISNVARSAHWPH